MKYQMNYITNTANTLIIVIHEIYGVNAHMKQTCASLSKQGYDVICPNLLNRESFRQSEEELAYEYFMNQVGFEAAVVQIKRLIDEKKKDYKNICLMGFSIGATIAWLCSEDTNVDGIIGFYGSRIRDYLNIVPACPVLLFFPREERSFSVEILLEKLAEKNIRSMSFDAEHGWMNMYDTSYNEYIAQQTSTIMNRFLLSIFKK